MSLPDQNSPAPEGNSPGFQASLRGASLWDLVQMECLAFTRRVVRITTVDDIGFLYFSGGQIVHARTRRSEGESAVMSILGWEEGSFEVVDAPWPERDTIGSTWQSLVMRAAQFRDEKPENLTNLVAFPNRAVGHSPRDSDPPTSDSSPEESPMTTDLDSIVRLSPTGETIQAEGAGAEELEALAAYACQLGQLIGEALGLDGFTGLESESKEWRVLVHHTDNGMIEAARAPTTVPTLRMREILGIKRP